jgi:hypothetical protein
VCLVQPQQLETFAISDRPLQKMAAARRCASRLPRYRLSARGDRRPLFPARPACCSAAAIIGGLMLALTLGAVALVQAVAWAWQSAIVEAMNSGSSGAN